MAAVCVIAVGVVWREAMRHTQAKLAYLDATASVFASATSRPVASGDAEGALFALRGVARAPDLIYARVVTDTGVRLAEIGSGVSLGTDARYGDNTNERFSLTAALRSRTLQVTRPIVQGGRIVGAITLVADNGDLMPTLAVSLAQTLLGALAALLVAVLIAARLQHWVVRPLLRLTSTVRHVSESHDYASRAAIESDDEVGELCGGFNVMLGEIEDRERKIMDLALSDAETDLPNRIAFEAEIAKRLAATHAPAVAVAALAVDRFQYVRGVIGYHLANDMLGELGARAVGWSAKGVVARISTDVIGLLLEAKDIEALRTRAAAMLAEAEAPLQIGSNALDVNLTLGLALFGTHADAPQALIERANIAVDQARAAHAKMAMFDEDSYQETASNLSLMTDMLRGLQNDELSIRLQPKLDIRSRAVCGAEVLTRWNHPTRGAVAPDLFVGMAEETGAIAALTHWSLDQAIACQHRLIAAGLDPSLAVNLSGRLLSDADFVDDLLDHVRNAPGPLCLEITETATIDNQERALVHISALIAAGASISIDDYGAGLSSLAYLKRIPAQELKIDKAFILSLGERQRDALLVKSTIDLAHSLGMRVIAEGVETEATLVALAAMGCDCAQGYFIGKPMLEADYVATLTAASQPQFDSLLSRA
jgi:predicted signal transduction protein with EAL and GGDEF domain